MNGRDAAWKLVILTVLAGGCPDTGTGRPPGTSGDGPGGEGDEPDPDDDGGLSNVDKDTPRLEAPFGLPPGGDPWTPGEEVPVTPGEDPEEVRGIVLLVVDTLRRDVLDCDAPGGVMPYTESLAAAGACVETVKSTSSWTSTGTATLLSGVNNDTHGIRESTDTLPADVLLAPDILREHGYTSVQISANRAATGGGISARFDHDYNVRFEPGTPTGEYDPAVLDFHREMLDALAPSLGSEGRFFIHYQLFSPHWEYCPPAAEAEGRTVLGDFDFCVDGANEIVGASGTFPEVIDYSFGLYQEECSFSDDHVRAILEDLDEAGLLRGTVIAITSDHGEEFLENGQYGHRSGLHWAQSDIPLVFWGSNVPEGAVLKGLFSGADVLPTLLDLAGLPIPEGMEGRSLMPPMEGVEEGAPYRALFDLYNADMGIRVDAITATVSDGSAWTLLAPEDDAWELYRADLDPMETADLYGQPEAAEAQAFLEAELASPVPRYSDWRSLRSVGARRGGE